MFIEVRQFQDKKSFISCICKELQTAKKNYIEYEKKNKYKGYFGTNPFFYNKEFQIMANKEHKFERWYFEIYISNIFDVQYCEAQINNRKVRFCNNISSRGEKDNDFKNITEFKEFLRREVQKS